jgi:putative transposase
MSAQRFSVGKQFRWQGETYEVRRLLPDGNLNVVNVQSGEARSVAFIQLVKALWIGELQFVVDGRPVKQVLQKDYVDWSDYPESLRAIAEYRLEIIRPFLDLAPDQRKKAIRARVKALRKQRQSNERTLKMVISVTSIYRWIDQYTKSGGDIRALIPDTGKRGGKQQSRLLKEVEAIVQSVLEEHYYVREKRTIDYFHREIAVRIEEENRQRPSQEQLKAPSRPTIARRIAALQVEDKLVAKRGKRAARQQLTQYGQTEYPTIPLERVEIDHTLSDLIVVDENDYLPLGRLTLTHCLDTATRHPLGYYLGFEPPSYLSVMACLYHAICPKDNVRERYGTEHDWIAYGIPYTLVIDNGKEFIGRDLEDACQLLGITLQQTPVKTPHFKAAVERMFGTLNTGLLHTLPGTTFSNPGQRGDYDSLKQACISLGDLDKMMHIFLVDIYAEEFHRGLQAIPARRWEQVVQNGFFPRVPSSAEELRILLGRVAYRTIQPYGINFHSLRYNCAELTLLRTRMRRRADKRVKIKYNPADLSCVHVYDPDDGQYIQVPALAQEYTHGLSLWKHQVIRNFVLSQQNQVDVVALGLAQRKIQAIVEESLQRKKLRTRTKIARWQTSGQMRGSSERREESETESVAGAESTATEEAVLPPPPALDFDLELDLEKLEETGWGVSYDLPDVREGGIPSHD